MRIYLDDLRPTPDVVGCDKWNDPENRRPYTHTAKTAQEAIALLETGEVTYISFDHDLGHPDNGTGYDVAKWIEEAAATRPDFLIPDWSIHSANPVGSANIQNAMLAAVRWRDWRRTVTT